MSLNTGTMIDDAKVLAHPWGQGPQPVSEMALIHYLSRLDFEVVSKISREAPQLLGAEATEVPITGSGNTAGYTLQTGALKYYDFRHKNASGFYTPIRIVPEGEYDNPPVHPAGVIRAGKFYPCDPSGQRFAGGGTALSWFNPSDGNAFTYRYISSPTRLSSRSDTLTSPDFAAQYFLMSLWSLILMLNGAPQELIQSSMLTVMETKSELGLTILKHGPTQSQAGGYYMGGYY